MTKVVAFLALAALLTGCGTFVKTATSEVAYDYSDFTSYDKPFAPSPDYAVSAHSAQAAQSVEVLGGAESPAVAVGSAASR